MTAIRMASQNDLTPFPRFAQTGSLPRERFSPAEVFSGRPFGAATDSYNLLHLKAGFQVPIAQTILGVNLTIRNLLDEEYTDFLYPYKGLPYQGAPVLNPGRDVRLMARYQF